MGCGTSKPRRLSADDEEASAFAPSGAAVGEILQEPGLLEAPPAAQEELIENEADFAAHDALDAEQGLERPEGASPAADDGVGARGWLRQRIALALPSRENAVLLALPAICLLALLMPLLTFAPVAAPSAEPWISIDINIEARPPPPPPLPPLRPGAHRQDELFEPIASVLLGLGEAGRALLGSIGFAAGRLVDLLIEIARGLVRWIEGGVGALAAWVADLPQKGVPWPHISAISPRGWLALAILAILLLGLAVAPIDALACAGRGPLCRGRDGRCRSFGARCGRCSCCTRLREAFAAHLAARRDRLKSQARFEGNLARQSAEQIACRKVEAERLDALVAELRATQTRALEANRPKPILVATRLGKILL